MNTAIFKQKTKTAIDLHKMLENATTTKAKQFKYLPDAQIEGHMAKIHDYIFAHKVDEHGRNACKEAAKGFAYTIPHIDRYAMDMKRCDIQEEDLIRHYRDVWPELPEQYKNKIRRVAKRYNEQVAATIRQLQEFVDHQSRHLNAMTDEQVEQVLDLEANEVEAVLSTDIRTYIKASTTLDDAHLMTPAQISEYLITVSKGTCIHWPTQIGKELQQRGFQKSEFVTAYYVELVS